jgi:hypothetical protein
MVEQLTNEALEGEK